MQPITPIEIRQKSFGKSFRGYRTDEVGAFLHSLAHAWEKLIAQLNEVKTALEESNQEVQRLQTMEDAILKTIKNSENTAHNIIEQAKKEADLKTRETELEIEHLLREVQDKAKAMEEDNLRRHQFAKERLARELEATKKVVQETEKYRDTLLQKLHHLAEDILTKGQSIKGSFKRPMAAEQDLKEDIQAPEKQSGALSKGLTGSADKPTSTQPRQDSIS